MYNKNPKDHKEERGRRIGKTNKITYNVQGELIDDVGSPGRDDDGADELP